MGLLDRFRKPTRDRFAADIMSGLRAAGVEDDLRYDPEEFRILRTRDGKYKGETGLANMFAVYAAKPYGERAATLAGYVRTFVNAARELPETFDDARPALRAKFWPRATMEFTRLRGMIEGTGKGPDVSGESIGTHLLLSPVYDWPDSSSSIPPSKLAYWGVSLYEALEVARENLAQTLKGYMQYGDGVYAFESGDTYDAARLALLDVIRDLEVTGRHVAMVPSRDYLLVTGSDDEAGLLAIVALAEAALSRAYPLSAAPLILLDDGWHDWMPPHRHPLYAMYRDLELKCLGPQYAEQKKLLDTLHQQNGIRVYVVPFGASKQGDGSLVSSTVWPEEGEALLPASHRVMFMRGGEKQPSAVGSWERVSEVAGHLMTPTDDYPPRFRVRGFPDEAVLEAIAARQG